MFLPVNSLLLLSLTSSSKSAVAHTIHPLQMRPRDTSDPSSTHSSNKSSIRTPLETQNGSHITSLSSAFSHNTYNPNNSNIILPTLFDSGDSSFDISLPWYQKNLKNYKDIKSGFCDLTDNFCSLIDANGTIREATPIDMSDQCVLWDTSCSGDKTLAMEKFFSAAFPDRYHISELGITNNDCFTQFWEPQSDCVTYNPPDRLLEWQKMKDWMRSPQCVSAAEEWQNMTGHQWSFIFDGGMNESFSDWYDNLDSSEPAPSCCERCFVKAQDVDMYYWLVPDADLSCLSIVAGSVRPLDYGATITTYPYFTETYWACNATNTKRWGAKFTELRTAIVSTIGDLAVKLPLINPWSPSPCVEDNTGLQGSNRSTKYRDGHASIRIRDHSLLIPSSITQAGSLPVSIVVSGSLTFTSPSIYANFHGLSLSDQCGSSTIETLMLSFSAGELSSIEGRLGMDAGHLSTKQFDFRDLPCPPQSVMEANWYKPAPGEPYRPLIAMPSKIRQAIPWLNFCRGDFFTAYDPPHVLVTEAALLPPSPAGDPKPASMPSPTQDPDTRATVAGKGSTTLRPAIVPTVDHPTATPKSLPSSNNNNLTPKPLSKNPPASETLPSGAKADPRYANQGSDPTKGNEFEHSIDLDQGSNPDQGNKADGDPEDGVSSSVVVQNDPKQNDKASLAGEEPKQNSPSMIIKTNNPASDGKTLAQPFIFPDPFDTPIKDQAKTIALTASGGRFLGGLAGADDVADPFITTIDNQVITAAPTAVAFSDTTLTPGSPGQTINGTLISLNTAGQLVIGTKTVPLETSSVGLGRLIMEGFGAGGPLIGGNASPSPSLAGTSSWNATSSNRTTTNADAAIFRGEAESLRRNSSGGLFWKAAAVAAVGIRISSRFG